MLRGPISIAHTEVRYRFPRMGRNQWNGMEGGEIPATLTTSLLCLVKSMEYRMDPDPNIPQYQLCSPAVRVPKEVYK